MSGSSKSLIRGINSVFDTWTENSSITEDLKHTIRLFLQKHNTLQIIHQSTNINNELFRIYNTYIKASNSLQKELLFLDLLTELVPVLKDSEVELWLKTYLKPSVDSASVDIRFVERSRGFLKATMRVEETNEELFKYRKGIAKVTVERLIESYMGKDLIEQDTQVFHEHMRFVKLNSWVLLLEYGLENPEEYFGILNKYVEDPKTRLEGISLLSGVVGQSEPPRREINESLLGHRTPEPTSDKKSDDSKVSMSPTTTSFYSSSSNGSGCIINTPLFNNLLKCLIYDSNEHVIKVSLNVFTMLLPQICTKIRNLSEIFFILARLILPECTMSNEVEWKVLSGELNNTLQWSHLATLLYGLYPYSLSTVMNSPSKYFQKHPPVFGGVSLRSNLTEKLKWFSNDLLVHPRFIFYDKNELEDPLVWMEEGKDAIEISIQCYNLNKKLSIHDFATSDFSNQTSRISSVTFDRSLEEIKFKEVKFESDGMQDLFSTHEMLYGPKQLDRRGSRKSSRKSSADPRDLNVNDLRSLAHRNSVDLRKNSNVMDSLVVPSPSTVETSYIHKEAAHSEKIGKVTDSDSKDKAATAKVQIGPSEKVHEIALQTLSTTLSPPETLNETLQDPHEVTTELHSLEPNALNFFQREILLLKNEVEFSNHMIKLNKHNYLKLRQSIKKNPDQSVRLENLTETHRLTKQTLKDLQLKLQAKESKENENVLLKRLTSLRDERDNLIKKYDTLTTQYSQANNNLLRLLKEIPNKDFEINNLKLKLLEAKEVPPTEDAIAEKNGNSELKEIEVVTGQESKAFKMSNQILSLREKNQQLTQQLHQARDQRETLEKKHAKKLESVKLDLKINMDLLHHQHERKIQELATTVVKFENLLEDKNAKIVQLQDIIKSDRSLGRSEKTSLNDLRARSISSLESTHSVPQLVGQGRIPQLVSYPPQPVRVNNTVVSNVNATQQPPVIRGRGGYQKRSKKLM